MLVIIIITIIVIIIVSSAMRTGSCRVALTALPASFGWHYTQFPSQDSGFFGPNPWKSLSAAVKLPIKKKYLGNPTLGNKYCEGKYCDGSWVYLSNETCLMRPHSCVLRHCLSNAATWVRRITHHFRRKRVLDKQYHTTCGCEIHNTIYPTKYHNTTWLLLANTSSIILLDKWLPRRPGTAGLFVCAYL